MLHHHCLPLAVEESTGQLNRLHAKDVVWSLLSRDLSVTAHYHTGGGDGGGVTAHYHTDPEPLILHSFSKLNSEIYTTYSINTFMYK